MQAGLSAAGKTGRPYLLTAHVGKRNRGHAGLCADLRVGCTGLDIENVP